MRRELFTYYKNDFGKEYEKRLKLDNYLEQQARVIAESVRVLKRGGTFVAVVPHHSNPLYYSDPTHRAFFGFGRTGAILADNASDVVLPPGGGLAQACDEQTGGREDSRRSGLHEADSLPRLSV